MGLEMIDSELTLCDWNRTVQLPILGVKKNPQQPLYTQLGVLTKGTIIEVCFFFCFPTQIPVTPDANSFPF